MKDIMRSKQDLVAVLGVRIDLVNISEALSRIENWINNGHKNYVCLCPNYSIMMAQKDVEFRNALNNAGMSISDGKSVVLVCRLRGYKKATHIRGSDLMFQVCEMTAQKGYSNFLYGGSDGTPEKLTEVLKQKIPDLKVSGTYSPPFRPLTQQEVEEIIDMINAARPDILWVGLGAPKQEIWMSQYIKELNVPVLVGVGAAFDFLSGNKKEAPKWMQKLGLEWLFRLLCEPRRLWKRNLYHPIFIIKALISRWIR